MDDDADVGRAPICPSCGVTALWQAAEPDRPWNDPAEDFDRAIAGPTSTVLGGFDASVADLRHGADASCR